jgi:hypothetical protein
MTILKSFTFLPGLNLDESHGQPLLKSSLVGPGFYCQDSGACCLNIIRIDIGLSQI